MARVISAEVSTNAQTQNYKKKKKNKSAFNVLFLSAENEIPVNNIFWAAKTVMMTKRRTDQRQPSYECDVSCVYEPEQVVGSY